VMHTDIIQNVSGVLQFPDCNSHSLEVLSIVFCAACMMTFSRSVL